jgi:hypothetical protein
MRPVVTTPSNIMSDVAPGIRRQLTIKVSYGSSDMARYDDQMRKCPVQAQHPNPKLVAGQVEQNESSTLGLLHLSGTTTISLSWLCFKQSLRTIHECAQPANVDDHDLVAARFGNKTRPLKVAEYPANSLNGETEIIRNI